MKASYRLCWGWEVQGSLLWVWVALMLLPLWSLFSIDIVRVHGSAKSNRVKYNRKRRKKPQVINSNLEFEKLRVRKENFKNEHNVNFM